MGQRFGKLTVIAPAPPQNHQTAWVCRCECGKEKIVLAGNLRKGLTRSCGCTRLGKRKDIKDRKFGLLTAIERLETTNGNETIWLCRCDCGAETKVQLNNLISGHTISCGCQKIKSQKDVSKRVEKLKRSPLTGRFETNKSAKAWRLISPSGAVFEIRNLSKFIRDNPQLFGIQEQDDCQTARIVKGISEAKSKGHRYLGWKAEEIKDTQEKPKGRSKK